MATKEKAPPPYVRRGATAVGVVGEILITLGVVALLFVAWQLWWTDVLAERSYAESRSALQEQWDLNDSAGKPPRPVDPDYGDTFALAYVPELHEDAWGVPIIEGTARDMLTGAMGHHPDTAVPGEVGNFTLAGHRTTYGAPLHNIETLASGDEVIIETDRAWYVYELETHEIIQRWEGWVLDPVPGRPRDATPHEAMITMYSCHPKFSSAQRYVWFGTLVDQYRKGQGRPPAIDTYGKA